MPRSSRAAAAWAAWAGPGLGFFVGSSHRFISLVPCRSMIAAGACGLSAFCGVCWWRELSRCCCCSFARSDQEEGDIEGGSLSASRGVAEADIAPTEQEEQVRGGAEQAAVRH